MGVVKRQTIKSVIYTYAGTIIGFVTVAILFPAYLSTSQIGVLNLVNRWSMMLMQLGTLGFPVAMIKYFPYFRDKERKHHGMLFTSLMVGLVGFLLTAGVLYLFHDAIIEREKEKSPLFSQYFGYVYLVTFGYLFFYILDIYSRAIYQSSAAVLLREFAQRILIVLLTTVFILNWIGFEQMAIGYFIILFIPTGLLLFFLWKKQEVSLLPNLTVLRSEHKSGIIQRSVFGLISGLGISGLLSIDVIMLNEYLGESSAGIYTTVFYFASLMLIPFRAFNRLGVNLIAEVMKDDDRTKLKTIYYNSSLTQFIIGIILLSAMLVNTDNIFAFLKPEYQAAYYVILIVGLGNLFEIGTGLNHSIIDNSKYYRFGTFFVGILILCTIGLNAIFIPYFDITGAAIGTALSLVIFNLIKTVFIYIKYKMFPFNLKHVWVLLVATLITAIVYFLPNLPNIYINVIFKSGIQFLMLFGIIYFAKFSADFNGHIGTLLQLLKLKK